MNIYLAENVSHVAVLQRQNYITSNPIMASSMETFPALLALCEGNPPVASRFPSQRAVTRSFDVFFDLRLNMRLNKQLRGRWFDTSSRSLWRHCNAILQILQRGANLQRVIYSEYLIEISNMFVYIPAYGIFVIAGWLKQFDLNQYDRSVIS